MSEFFIRQIGQKNLPDLSIYGNSFVYITLLRISGTAPRNTKMFRTNLLFRGFFALRAAPPAKKRADRRPSLRDRTDAMPANAPASACRRFFRIRTSSENMHPSARKRLRYTKIYARAKRRLFRGDIGKTSAR